MNFNQSITGRKSSAPSGSTAMVHGDLELDRIFHLPEKRQQRVEFHCGTTVCRLELPPKSLQTFSAFQRECMGVGLFVRCPDVEERSGASAARQWADLVQLAMEAGGAK